MFVLWTIMAVWVWEVEPVEPPVCVVEPVVVPVLVPDVPFPVVVGTVQPTPPLGAGPVQFDGLPGTVLPGCVFEVEPVLEPVPVVEPVVVPLPCVVVEVPVALPVPVVLLPELTTGAIVLEPVFPLDPVVVPDLVPVDEPELDPEPGDVELPVPVFGPVQPFGPRTCPDGHAPPGRPGVLWPPVVAPEPQTPFTYPVVQGTGVVGGPPAEFVMECAVSEVPPEALPVGFFGPVTLILV